MYLKSLVLKGFKSFADRSVINFEPGLSAIVGPNGSGKSNISEAVLWVLGERKTSNLRVHSMEELIFSGSSARPPAKVAEVSLVLDNSDGTIPVEFSEVMITRRMHHNGESEYLINGSPALRRDIIDILHDSGIGEGVHSVITQGNLTAMIESKPEDRMLLLEEASGILKHKNRKARAEKQLAKMDDTLDRVHDTLKVIEQQLRPLERQASRARQHEEYEEELKQISLALAVDDLRTLQSSWNEVVAREKEIDAEAELVKYRLEEKEEEVSKRQAILEEKGLFVGDLNEQRNRCQSIMAGLDSSMRLLEEKGKNMVSRLSELRATIHASQSRLKSAQEERLQTETEMDDADAKLKGLYTTFNDLSRKSEQVNKERHAAQEQYDSLSSKLRSNESALSTTKDNLARAESSLESLKVEENFLNERLEQSNQEVSKAQGEMKAAREKSDSLSAEMLRVEGELKLARSDVDKRVRLLDQARKEMGANRDKHADIEAEIKGLREVEKAFESATPAMSWLAEHRNEFAGVVGKLSRIVKAPEGVDAIVERLLGPDVSAMLTVDLRSAGLIAERLIRSSQDSGEVSFIPLSDPSGSGDGRAAVYGGDGVLPDGASADAGGEGSAGAAAEGTVIDASPSASRSILPRSDDGERLIDLLEYDDMYSEVVESLLGDVYLADNVSQAVLFHQRNPGVRFAGRDGSVVWPSGKITLGTEVSDMQGVLERQRKLNELLVEEEECTANLSDSEMRVSEAEKALEVAQQDGFELSEELAKLQGSYDSATAEVERCEKKIMQLTDSIEQTKLKLRSVGVRRGQSSPLAQEYRKRIDNLNETVSEMREQTEAASSKLLQITQEKSGIAEQISSAKAEMETCRQSIDFRRRRLEKLDDEISSLEKTLDVSRETEQSLQIIKLRVDPLYSTFEELREGISEKARKLQEEAKLTQSDSSSLKDLIDEAKKARDEAREQQQQVQLKLNDVRIEKAKLQTEVKNAMRRIEEENGASIEAALEVPSPDDREAAEERAAKLRRKIDNMGAVNHVAMEEYEKLKAKRDYIKEQIADLESARKKLDTISRALDNKMKKQFRKTFDEVNESFRSLYEQLAPGDTGELVILEGGPGSQPGIEIAIHPHNMKLTSLTQLSGGQSALVAIAFLFAVYMTRKAPFYILDEIEPSLDGTNLQRVCDLLSSMRNETQLIMVTHQRQSMEIADILYGVTKQASGVSKVVSQKLDQALALVEEDGSGDGDGAGGDGDAEAGRDADASDMGNADADGDDSLQDATADGTGGPVGGGGLEDDAGQPGVRSGHGTADPGDVP